MEFFEYVLLCSMTLSNGVDAMLTPSALPNVLSRIYHNQLALEPAVTGPTLGNEPRGSTEVADNVRGALIAITRNANKIQIEISRLQSEN